MKTKKSLSKELRAQAIAEIAVFGAIVVFLIGTLVYQTVSIAFSQEMALKTMREAMKLSHAQGRSVSLTVIEDRLTPAVEKFGTTDRMMLVASSSASFSQNLFMPKTWGQSGELPRIDMWINGEKRSYTSAAWKQSTCTTFTTKTAVDSMYCCSGISWYEEEPKDVAALLDDEEVNEKNGVSASYDIGDDDHEPPGKESEELIVGLEKDGTCKYMDYNEGEIDPTDPSQGFQPQMEFATGSDISVTTNHETNTLTRTAQVKNRICRYVKLNPSRSSDPVGANVVGDVDVICVDKGTIK